MARAPTQAQTRQRQGTSSECTQPSNGPIQQHDPLSFNPSKSLSGDPQSCPKQPGSSRTKSQGPPIHLKASHTKGQLLKQLVSRLTHSALSNTLCNGKDCSSTQPGIPKEASVGRW